jgi:cyclophilin family peptidyl-prolyl cis-trans isomerase
VPSQDKRQRKKENARLAREARIAADRRKRRLRTARNAGIAVAIFVLSIVILNLLTGDDDSNDASSTTSTTVTSDTTTPGSTVQPVKLTGFAADPAKTYTATITTNFGDIVIDLDSKNAPKAAGRFIELARKKFYDGDDFHRVVQDFVIQGGDPSGTEAGTGNDPVVGEVPTDNYPLGSIAAAKTETDPPGTFDSQFFIVTGAEQGAALPNEYARFGMVTAGLDVAERIEALAPGNGGDAPTGKATMEKITITES